MSIEDALQQIDLAMHLNFPNTIPDAFLAPAAYRLWLDTLRAYQDLKRLQILQARTDMQQDLLLELDERIPAQPTERD
jgi:hypothetical protein